MIHGFSAFSSQVSAFSIHSTRSGGFEQVGVELDRCRLADEIEAQQHGGPAVTMLDPTLDASQRSGFDAHAHALADGRGQTHFQIRFQGQENIFQLPAKRFLIEHLEEIGDMVVLARRILLSGFKLKKDVTRKERFLEHNGLAPVFVGGIIAGKSRGDAMSLAVLDKLLLPSRSGMGYEPTQFWHGAKDLGKVPGCQSEVAPWEVGGSSVFNHG